jgi:DNA-binding transcriptional MerR regulator
MPVGAIALTEKSHRRAVNGFATDTFSSIDVSSMTGVSLRQLQWWDEQGVVSPVQRGHRRMYQLHEVVEVALITELRRKGISLQKIRKILRFLKKELGSQFMAAVQDGGEVHLLTDGKTLFLKTDHSSIVDVLKNADQPIIGVCISDQVERLTSRLGLKKTVQPEHRGAGQVAARSTSRVS